MVKFQARYLIYGFTSYSVVQLIGFLGTAYTFLIQPMTFISLFLILLTLIVGVAEWLKAQSKVQHNLTGIKVFACFSGSFVLIALIVFGLSIGAWIAI